MKTIIALLTATLLLAASQAGAQEELSAPTMDDPGVMPEPMEMESPSLTETAPEAPAEEIVPEPMEGSSAATEAVMDGQVAGEVPFGESVRYFDACPPLFESSGSWLQRGYWYGEFDLVLFNRSWDQKGLLLMHETTVGTSPKGPTANAQSGANLPFLTFNELTIDGSKPGTEGVARVSLGRFLFRDGENRDHLAQFTWLGGGDFAQRATLEASTTAGLQVTDYIDRVNLGFDGAQSARFRYSSDLDSLEANYIVRQRMRRDRLVLQPNGDWVRAANPSRTYSFLAGGRYVNVDEFFLWEAFDIPTSTAATPTRGDGLMRVSTDNNLLGTQIGGSWGYETARWSITLGGKAGAYWNSMDMKHFHSVPGVTNVTNPAQSLPANNADIATDENNLSFVGETQLLGRWHLRPNLSIRAGLELLYINGLALAPMQINFQPGGHMPIASSGDEVLMGSSIGMEWYR